MADIVSPERSEREASASIWRGARVLGSRGRGKDFAGGGGSRRRWKSPTSTGSLYPSPFGASQYCSSIGPRPDARWQYIRSDGAPCRAVASRANIERDGLLAPGLAIPVFIDVCRALGAAHKKGVIHRDLKPGNIFLCDDGSAKVLDFGMSKLASAESLTQSGYTLGTPEYMAPEQCIGAQVEPGQDMYALGVLMYEALTGALPIVAANRRELLDLHQRQIPVPMRVRRADLPIPVALDAAVMQCLKKRLNRATAKRRPNSNKCSRRFRLMDCRDPIRRALYVEAIPLLASRKFMIQTLEPLRRCRKHRE